jgi:SAM-dependent methyltransferase
METEEDFYEHPHPTNSHDLGFDERFSNFLDVIETQTRRPYEGDPVVGAFFSASQRMIFADYKPFTEMLDDYIMNRPEIEHAPYAAILLMRTFHHYMRDRYSDYPSYDYYDSGKWEVSMRDLLEDENMREAVHDDLLTHNLQSNKKARAWGLLLPTVGLIESGRFSEPLRILEVGGARMHVLKFLALTGIVSDMRHDPIDVVEKRTKWADQAQTEAIMRYDDYEFPLGESLSIDILAMKAKDKAHEDRVFNDTFLPSELIRYEADDPKIRRKIDDFRLVEMAQPPMLEFLKLDFSDREKTEHFLLPASFDIVFISSVFYQLGRKRQAAVLETSERVVNDNGLVIIQDELHVRPGDPSKLSLYRHWSRDWQYHTVAKDMHSPDVYQPLISWETARCRRLMFELGRLSTGSGERLTLPDMLGI